MNEGELQLLVARAREAEGSPSTPPPGLAGAARVAARRRRRLVTIGAAGAVVAVVAAAVVVPWLVADDADDPLPAVDTGELAEHGRPCPSVLPTPTDDEEGHGFGASTAADKVPRFAEPDTAWVCRYGTHEIGHTESGGTAFEWRINNTARRLDDSLLPQVTNAFDSIELRSPEPYPCTADLGPQWMLVTSSGGDLTGVAVEGYGCREVRLTDNPFVTAPGDPQDGGTVPGVLTASGLADTLETWWNTSPADVENTPTPDELRVTCTDDGPQVEATTVAATPAGVVLVVDSTMSEGSYLTYTSDGVSGGDDLGQVAGPATYAFPPGPVTLGCASPQGMDETGAVSVEVTDPYGYWRTSTVADFGCRNGSQPSWISVSGEGLTPEDAVGSLLDDFADQLDRDRSTYDAEPAPTGYSGARTQTWMAFRRGTPAFTVAVTQTDSAFTATPDVLCGIG